jgi:diguanylate cyclase (GGDEF)-like protein
MELEGFERKDRSRAAQDLPLHRQDEIGQIARVIDRLTARTVREYHEADRLRRTLDDRVEKSTRQATQQLRQLAMRDPLTGLGNRRFLEENFDQLIKSALNSGTPVACVAIDMDNFKKINDTLGHKAGDDLLIFLSTLIRGSLREDDFSVRLGGDEFVVVLPGCSLSRATQFAQQLITLFRQNSKAVHASDIPVSLSIGIATLSSGIDSSQGLLSQADDNLYSAKRAGKGRVVAR